jgi:hypothetical protein
MKHLFKALAFVCFVSATAQAQFPAIQYFHPNDKTSIGKFETTKEDTVVYTGQKVRIGGGFTQDYQFLSHSNTALTDSAHAANRLAKLTNGLNLAEANLLFDVQLEDGVRLNLALYLSSRHHNETWVKNGYLQLDKLPFIDWQPLNDAMKYLTIKAGALEVDYGDQHFRRTDGGNSILNPFVENYIMDEFATEVGGEVYYHHPSGVFLMGGVTSGMLNPTVIDPAKIDAISGDTMGYSPAIHFKVGYDNQISPDVRIRLTASGYSVSSTSSSTLFGGDRTGSHYFFVLENPSATTSANPFSGRFNPGFTNAVTTFMVNPFIKISGLEVFAAYEAASGRAITEKDTRKATQLAADALYRFGTNDDFYIGGRYNKVTARIAGYTEDVNISRVVGVLGWYMTKNIAMKAEYVDQKYDGFKNTDIRSGGEFKGAVVEATIGF